MRNLNKLYLVSMFFLIASCGGGGSGKKNESTTRTSNGLNKPDVKNLSGDLIYKEMWHLNNTGQKAYSNSNAKIGIDLNLAGVSETGKGVHVLIADTPAELNHQDLSPNTIKDGSINLFAVMPVGENHLSVPTDELTHGTNVAGIIAAAKNEKNGFRGIAYQAGLGTAKRLSKSSSTPTIGISPTNQELKLYEFAFDNKYQIINESYGAIEFTYPSITYGSLAILESVEKKIKTKNEGFIIVTSAGNDACSIGYAKKHFGFSVNQFDLLTKMTETKASSLSGNDLEYMQRICSNQSNFDMMNSFPYSIVVGAASAQGIITDYSSFGPNLWITGFGGSQDSVKINDSLYNYSVGNNPEIITTNVPFRNSVSSKKDFDKNESLFPENKNYNYTASFNGTSAASPTVAGVVALMLEANPKLTFWEVKYILAKTARRNILVENPKPYCVKVLEKINIFDNANNFWGPWNRTWVKNAANNYHHHAYGFGLVDAQRAIELAKNFKYPYEGKVMDNETVSDYTVNKVVNEGQQEDNISLTLTKDLTIQAVNLYPVLSAEKADGISVELISPSGTVSTIIYPGNAFIPNSGSSTRLAYPGNTQVQAENNVGFAANSFYEENSKGIWKMRVKNGNKTGSNNKITVIGYRMKIIGYTK